MDVLQLFLQQGCIWHGPGEHELGSRATYHVLSRLAGLWPTQAEKQARGLCVSIPLLGNVGGGSVYKESTVRAALSILQKAGLIRRVRGTPVRDGREPIARTHINFQLVAAAQSWAAERRALTKPQQPPKVAFELPMIWTGASSGVNDDAGSERAVSKNCTLPYPEFGEMSLTQPRGGVVCHEGGRSSWGQFERGPELKLVGRSCQKLKLC